MLFLSIISFFISFILYVVILIDMFKKKVIWGFVGLFFFPATYFHSIKWYFGKKKITTLIFWITSMAVIIGFTYTSFRANDELKLFLSEVKNKHSYSCHFANRTEQSGLLLKYFVWCEVPNIEHIKNTNIQQMTDVYKEKIILPVIETYKETYGQLKNRGIVIGVNIGSGIVACYEIHNPSNIVRSWFSNIQNFCN